VLRARGRGLPPVWGKGGNSLRAMVKLACRLYFRYRERDWLPSGKGMVIGQGAEIR
jgi:hypothetical protein